MGISELRKKYGSIDTQYVKTVKFLDDLLTGRGFPLGSVIEFVSEPGVGKSTISCQIAKILMSVYNFNVLYLDVERALTDSLKQSIGLDEFESSDSFIHLCPMTFSDLDDILKDLESINVKLVILDSITAVIPDKKVENDDAMYSQPGLKSLSQATFIEFYRPKFIRNNITLIYINQLRTHFNFRSAAYLDSSGSLSLQFAADIRCKFSINKLVKDEGYELEINTLKNKFTVPRQSKKFIFSYAKGIDIVRSYVDYLIETGYISQSGSYFKFNDKSVQGYKPLVEYFSNNPDLLNLETEYTNVLKRII